MIDVISEENQSDVGNETWSDFERLHDGPCFLIFAFAFDNDMSCGIQRRFKENTVNNLIRILPFVSKEFNHKARKYLQLVPLDVDLSGFISEPAVDFICEHNFKIGTLRQVSGERSNSLRSFTKLLTHGDTQELHRLELSICKQPSIQWAEALSVATKTPLCISEYSLKIYYESFTAEIISSPVFNESLTTLTLQVFFVGCESFENIQIYNMTPISDAIKSLKKLKKLTFISVLGETASVMPFHLDSSTLEEFTCRYHNFPVKMGTITCPKLKLLECYYDEKFVNRQDEQDYNSMEPVFLWTTTSNIPWRHGGSNLFRRYYSDFQVRECPFKGLNTYHPDCVVRLISPIVPMTEWK